MSVISGRLPFFMCFFLLISSLLIGHSMCGSIKICAFISSTFIYLFVLCDCFIFYLFCSDKSRAALFKMSPCADLGLLTKGGHLSFKWYLAVPHCPMLLGIVTLHLQMILYIFKWYLPVPHCHRVLQQKTFFCLRLDYKGIVLVSKENIF